MANLSLGHLEVQLRLDADGHALLKRLEALNIIGVEIARNSPTWPYVLAFARLMEGKLDRNRHKGNAEGWRKDTAQALFKRLDEEVAELKLTWKMGELEEIPGEAADVANFAMMIADIFNGFDGPGVERRG